MENNERRGAQVHALSAGKDTERSPLASIGLETGLLGAILLRGSMHSDAAYLTEEDFSDPGHKRLWRTIIGMVARGEAFSASLISARHPDLIAEIGGGEALNNLLTKGEQANKALSEYSTTLRDLALRREMEKTANGLRAASHDPNRPAADALAGALRRLKDQVQSRHSSAKSSRDVGQQAATNLATRSEAISTGIPSLDSLLGGGLYPGRSLGIGGRFGAGKTMLMGSISHNLAKREIPHLVISFEMPPEDIEFRNQCRELGINSEEAIMTGDPRIAQQLSEVATRKPEVTFYEYAPGRSDEWLQQAILRAIYSHGIKGFMVDYWQLVRGKKQSETRDEHLEKVAMMLNDIAHAEGIFAMILSQHKPDETDHGSEGLIRAADAYIKLTRERNEDAAWVEVQKNRYIRPVENSQDREPTLILDMAGPHLRAPEGADFLRGASRGSQSSHAKNGRA